MKGAFHISKKTGFESSGPVLILKEGKPFYRFDGNGSKIHFNLPSGEYFTKNEITPSRPVRIRFPRKRKRERSIPIPKNIVVSFEPNPNKATINLTRGTIKIDPSFRELGECVLRYILYHEIGHFFYITEEFCDEYAQERMLNEGFNQTQVIEASARTKGLMNERHFACEDKVLKSIKKRRK